MLANAPSVSSTSTAGEATAPTHENHATTAGALERNNRRCKSMLRCVAGRGNMACKSIPLYPHPPTPTQILTVRGRLLSLVVYLRTSLFDLECIRTCSSVEVASPLLPSFQPGSKLRCRQPEDCQREPSAARLYRRTCTSQLAPLTG